MYRLDEAADYMALIHAIKINGYDVDGTYELVGETIKIDVCNLDSFVERFENQIDVPKLYSFIEYVRRGMIEVVGPYDTSKYLFLNHHLNKLIEKATKQKNESRQIVLHFPVDHCFTSIQFLYREKRLNIICNMRSCNAIDNLLMDAALCFDLGTRLLCKQDKMNLIMQFGSLHIFKDKLNVL